ncbi:hypothetical protein KNE206_17260 [Kitasatospora sp. NE20-6]
MGEGLGDGAALVAAALLFSGGIGRACEVWPLPVSPSSPSIMKAVAPSTESEQSRPMPKAVRRRARRRRCCRARRRLGAGAFLWEAARTGGSLVGDTI